MSIEVGVGVVCTRVVRGGALQLLMVRRGRNPGKGAYALPGGRMNFGETLKACGEREVMEETRVQCDAEPFGLFAFDVPVSAEKQYVVVDLRAQWVAGEPVAGDDAEEALFVDRDAFTLLMPKIHPATLELVRRLKLFD